MSKIIDFELLVSLERGDTGASTDVGKNFLCDHTDEKSVREITKYVHQLKLFPCIKRVHEMIEWYNRVCPYPRISLVARSECVLMANGKNESFIKNRMMTSNGSSHSDNCWFDVVEEVVDANGNYISIAEFNSTDYEGKFQGFTSTNPVQCEL